MEMIISALAGAAGGALGGMGMGGGTLLIPILTMLCGFSQHFAQGANLVAFIPMSAVSLAIHAKNGLLRPSYFLTIALPAAVMSVVTSLIAVNLAGGCLRTAFGVFLIIIGIYQFINIFSPSKKDKLPVIERRRNKWKMC